MIVVWLIVVIAMAGEQPVKLTDKKQPDLATCWANARHAVERAQEIEGHFEFSATCSIVKSEDDPA